MKLHHHTSLMLLVMFLSSCASRSHTRSLVHGQAVPRHPRWSSSVIKPSNASLLPDPDSLYVFHYRREQMTGSPETMLDGYHFYRFWADGRLLYRNLLVKGREPDARDGDTFGYGTLPGRYSVQGTRITIETFNMLGEYSRRHGTLHPQGIVIEERRGFESRFVRRQLPRGAMKKRPDW